MALRDRLCAALLGFCLAAGTGCGHPIGITLSDRLAQYPKDEQVCALAWAPDGGRFATGSCGGRVRVWTLDGAIVVDRQISADAIRRVAWSSDGTSVQVARIDGPFNMDKQRLCSVNATTGAVEESDASWLVLDNASGGKAYAPQGDRLAVGMPNGSVEVWSVRRRLRLSSTPVLAAPVTSLAFDSSGTTVLAGAADGEVRFLDATTGQDLGGMYASSDVLMSAASSASGRWLAASSWEGMLFVWDLQTGELALARKAGSEAVKSVAFSADEQRIVTAGMYAGAKVFDRQTGALLRSLVPRDRGLELGLEQVSFSPDGSVFAAAPFLGRTFLLASTVGSELMEADARAELSSPIAWRPDGSMLAVTAFPAGVFLFAGGRQVRKLPTMEDGGYVSSGLAWSPDGSALAVSRGRLIQVMDVNGTALAARRWPGLIRHIVYHPSGWIVLSRTTAVAPMLIGDGAADVIEAWEPQSDQSRVLSEHSSARTLTVGPGGTWVAATGAGLRLFRWSDGAGINLYATHTREGWLPLVHADNGAVDVPGRAWVGMQRRGDRNRSAWSPGLLRRFVEQAHGGAQAELSQAVQAAKGDLNVPDLVSRGQASGAR